MEEKEEYLWEATMDELMNGYGFKEGSYECLICKKKYEENRIYSVDERLYDAKGAIRYHVKEEHGSMLDYLLNKSSGFLGVSEVQKQLLVLIAQGNSDKEIAEKLGVAHSTIRNHRFKLREKEKQARMFLAVMNMLTDTTNRTIKEGDSETLCDAHKTATTLDDRYNITDKERETTIKTYMDENGGLKSYPAREKKKLIVLTEIAKNFVVDKVYTEKEVNRILGRIFSDYPTIRRALIEYGFIERSNDCSTYRVKV